MRVVARTRCGRLFPEEANAEVTSTVGPAPARWEPGMAENRQNHLADVSSMEKGLDGRRRKGGSVPVSRVARMD